MDAEPKPFPEWSKKKKVKYFATLKDLFLDPRKMVPDSAPQMPEKRNWKGKEGSK